ncbi:MAG: hypothetical protein JWL85_254 [Candidatus Saccharibacteria bacterium]|nr:hypothetical protein [Candidatus Saccharibacteria bacterium]
MRAAILAVAKLANVQISEAIKANRQHPLFGNEIDIKEELINLEEAIRVHHIGAASLKKYPTIEKHVMKEREQILVHCIGLVSRMLRGRKLDFDYTEEDIAYATKKLVRLIVKDAEKFGYFEGLNANAFKALLPYMTAAQYIRYSKRPWVHPLVYLRPLMPMTLRLRYV